jgi:predicted AAA+ superfamily ATPase
MAGRKHTILPRLIAEHFDTACRVMPVVVLTGARQTGKSTFVRSAPGAADRRYLSLDARDVRDQAEVDPAGFVGIPEPLTIDEVQRVPELLSAIKLVVDAEEQRQAGRFVLTGSANLLLMRRVNETLAGRASYLTLWPMTRREQLGLGRAGLWSELLETPRAKWRDLVNAQTAPAEDWKEFARRGGYPRPALTLHDPAERALWFDGYVNTYLERDVPDLSPIESIPEFRRLMRVAALHVGTLLNQSELARQTAIPQSTVQRYVNLLETSYQLVRLPPYAVSRTRRLVRSPKVYWSDAGLALALSGESAPTGAHFENLVAHDLLAWCSGQPAAPTLMYWRTAAGREVDFVVETRSGALLAIEVKATARPSSEDVGPLREFLDDYKDRVVGGLLLHRSDETFWISEQILAVPWWRVI